MSRAYRDRRARSSVEQPMADERGHLHEDEKELLEAVEAENVFKVESLLARGVSPRIRSRRSIPGLFVVSLNTVCFVRSG